MDWDSGQSKIEPGRIQSKKLIKRQITCLHLVWGCCHGGYIQMILYGFAWVCRPTYQIIKDTPRTQCCLFLGHNFGPVWQQTFVDYSCCGFKWGLVETWFNNSSRKKTNHQQQIRISPHLNPDLGVSWCIYYDPTGTH